jgi:hypothetical protein
MQAIALSCANALRTILLIATMVDYVSLVISIISFIGVVLVAGITAWANYYSDERARLSETDKIVAKYRDPLLLAAQDLQCSLYHIVDDKENPPHRDDPHSEAPSSIYACFAVGQFFSWSHMLHRHAQFLSFSTDKHNEELVGALYKIQKEFGEGHYGQPFVLWRCQQMGIGEEMTTGGDSNDTENFCKGYATFKKRWEDEKDDFKKWFSTIKDGYTLLTENPKDDSNDLKQHVRRLQHLLLELMVILDPRQPFKMFKMFGIKKCQNPPSCPCKECDKHHGPSQNKLEV